MVEYRKLSGPVCIIDRKCKEIHPGLYECDKQGTIISWPVNRDPNVLPGPKIWINSPNPDAVYEPVHWHDCETNWRYLDAHEVISDMDVPHAEIYVLQGGKMVQKYPKTI